MLAFVKKLLIFLVISTISLIVGVLIYNHNRTYFNDDNFKGNTAGNIYNGGLFSEYKGRIYFSNDNDDGSLYVMNSDTTNIKKIHDDKAVYINVDDNYIYYVRANNTRQNNSGSIFTFNNTGVYRLNRNGTNMKLITKQPGAYLTLGGNHLYLQRYDVQTGLNLYRYRIDATMERLLIDDAVIPASYNENGLYYTGLTGSTSIHRLDLSSFTSRTLLEGQFTMPILHGDYIYYLNRKDNYSLNRMNIDGTDDIRLVKERVFTFNITNSGKFLYYQIDNLDQSRISRLNLDTMEAEILLEGNYKQIHVTENYVFFKDFDNTNTYVISADGNTKLGVFDPPVIK